jgi:hypothetical protein
MPGAKLLSPIELLNIARRALPSLDYALGAVGVAAAAALVASLIGNGILILGVTFIAMLLLFVFATLVSRPSKAVNVAGTAILWSVTVSVCGILIFAATAIVFEWPPRLASFILNEPLRNEPPTLITATPEFIIGRWYVRQDVGVGSFVSDIEYHSDGTCKGFVIVTDAEGRSNTTNPPDCFWKFERVPDDASSYKVIYSFTNNPRSNCTQEYRIISHDQVEHTSPGAGGNYIARRMK